MLWCEKLRMVLIEFGVKRGQKWSKVGQKGSKGVKKGSEKGQKAFQGKKGNFRYFQSLLWVAFLAL